MTTPLRTDGRDAAPHLLDLAQEDPSVLAVLTDEELLALDGPDAPVFADSPFLAAAAQEEPPLRAEAAAEVALRSLVARGVVVLDEDAASDPEDGAPRLSEVDPTIAALLRLRRTARGILAVHRQAGDRIESVVVHLYPQDGVLEEHVSADGFHRFLVPTRAVLSARLDRYIDADSVAGDEDGEEIVATAEELDGGTALAAALEDTRSLSVITVAAGDGGSQHTVMATPDALLVMAMPGEEDTAVGVRTLSAAGLRALVEELLPG